MSEIIDRPVEAASEASEVASVPHLVLKLLSISKSTRALVDLMLAGIGIAVGQDQLLDALDAHVPITVAGVSTVLNVRPSTVTKMVDRLVTKGLVRRREYARDARRTLLTLTPEGVLKRAEVHAVWKKLEAYLTGDDTKTDPATTAAALRTIDTVLKSKLARLR